MDFWRTTTIATRGSAVLKAWHRWRRVVLTVDGSERIALGYPEGRDALVWRDQLARLRRMLAAHPSLHK